jgi:carbonic anhydrase
MSTIDRMIEANRFYADGFGHGDLASPPARKVAVVTCMDARMDPAAILGLEPGDAHVIRNAGGAAAEAVRSLVISQQFLGTTEVAVIKHTKCGMQGLTDEKVDAHCDEHGIPAKGRQWLGFPELEEAVAADVELLKGLPEVRASVVRGFVYDVVSGELREVVPAPGFTVDVAPASEHPAEQPESAQAA